MGLIPIQAVVSGDAVNTPVLVYIRERYAGHGAARAAATAEWRTVWERMESEMAGVRSPNEGED
jgi:hypothetical protein